MIYRGEYTNEISFPIGGIGTGSFGIAGNGMFVDWEIFNRPDKGSILPSSHIAVKAKKPDGSYAVKILNGDLNTNLTGIYRNKIFIGFGFGPNTGTMCGLPHFKEVIFEGTFPIAKLTFRDDDFPADVVMTVFNPFIPLDSFNSSIPAGFFQIEFINKTEENVEYSAYFSLKNPFAVSKNDWIKNNGKNILKLASCADPEAVEYGDLSIISDASKVEIQQYWYRGGWSDSIDVFVNELFYGDGLKNRVYDTPGKGELGTLASYQTVKAGERGVLRFVLSWNIPTYSNTWDKENLNKTWKNYYATVFPSSVDSALYCMENFDMLYQKTVEFRDALYSCSMDQGLIEAISATLSVLKSPTVLRLDDGSFWAWEGVHQNVGSCEGTCHHVWNYAYALCFLFPDLERSIRENEFKYCTEENGFTIFRMSLPRGNKKTEGTDCIHACVDGQMGIIFKTYREWKISGDGDWLKRNWDTVKKILSFAWSKENEDQWDADQDGVLEGRQHHTLDEELFGPSAWLEGFYLTALKAGAEMAEYLGDGEFAEKCRFLFQKGYDWSRENLFNGEYFIQKVDLNDKSLLEKFQAVDKYWYEEGKEMKYQIGEGSEIDQLCGQWHATICGLGNIFDEKQIQTALKSLYKYNFKPSMRNVINTWRIFSLNDEAGTIMCEYPSHIRRPIISVPYHRETMTGFEYALAGLMLSRGMESECSELVKAVRNRYDGKKRNPWNEIECGSNYARAMASYALIPIYSGFIFDLPARKIGFAPISKDDFRSIFSVGSGWGCVEWTDFAITVTLRAGFLELAQFAVQIGKKLIKDFRIDGKEIKYAYDGQSFSFVPTKIEKTIEVIFQ